MRKLNIMEDIAEDKKSGGNSYHVQPLEWETRDDEDDDEDADADDNDDDDSLIRIP